MKGNDTDLDVLCQSQSLLWKYYQVPFLFLQGHRRWSYLLFIHWFVCCFSRTFVPITAVFFYWECVWSGQLCFLMTIWWESWWKYDEEGEVRDYHFWEDCFVPFCFFSHCFEFCLLSSLFHLILFALYSSLILWFRLEKKYQFCHRNPKKRSLFWNCKKLRVIWIILIRI